MRNKLSPNALSLSIRVPRMSTSNKKPGQREYETALKLASARKPNFGEAHKLLLKAEQLQHGDAAYALATWHLFGRCVAKDSKKAMVLLKRATRRGSADAAFDLAISYERGGVIEKNLRRAFELFITAALRYDREQRPDQMYSFSEAAYEVARCYRHGIGTDVDKALSRMWMMEGKAIRKSRNGPMQL